jgi:hypothetical protein
VFVLNCHVERVYRLTCCAFASAMPSLLPEFQKKKNQILEDAADEPHDDRHPSINIGIADQRLVDLNLALHVAPPVSVFLRHPILLPNKISCKDKKPTARLFRFFKSRPSVTVSDLIGGTFSS